MHWKRTTAPDGIPGSPGPPRTAALRPTGRQADGALRAARVTLELARSRGRLRHRPTRRAAAHDGRARRPLAGELRLDAAVNWLPESLPADFPHGSVGLRFAHAGGELRRAAQRLGLRALS